MSWFFVPYAGKKPAAVNINGHRLVILAKDPDIFADKLDAFGADKVKRMPTGSSSEEETFFLNKIAEKSHAGVVIAPGDVEVEDVIRNLQVQLPWLQ